MHLMKRLKMCATTTYGSPHPVLELICPAATKKAPIENNENASTSMSLGRNLRMFKDEFIPIKLYNKTIRVSTTIGLDIE